MSLWRRLLRALGIRPSTGDIAIEGDRVVLRELDRAKAIPQEPEQPGQKHMGTCERCQGVLRNVVFTTAGNGAQVEIWRAYPLALDGWVCASCGWAAMPRVITTDESVEYGRRGAEHAANGELDDAEFWFRRIIGSWPGYPAGYADMGQVCVARADEAEAVEDKRRHRRDAEAWFRKALKADGERRIPAIRAAFARVVALNGNEEEALETLDELIALESVNDELRGEARELAEGIRGGKALFTRATELVRSLALEPAGAPLTAEKRRTLQEGRKLLLEASKRAKSFASLWFLGKVELRLGNAEAALAALREAHETQPDQPDGARELCSAYLELGRAAEALPLAKRAIELSPDDTGLRCNLALVLLLVGEVTEARALAAAALEADPADAITRNLLAMIDQVVSGERKRPTTLKEAEGRGR